MIIAIKEDDRLVLGFSNRDLWLHLHDSDLTDEENVAVKYAKNGTLFACAYTDRASDLILHDPAILDAQIDVKGLVRNTVPHMKKKLEDSHCIKDGSFRNTLTIYQNGHLYDVSPTFSVTEVDDCLCHGFNSAIAQGALDLTKEMKPEDRIITTFSFFGRETNQNMFPIIITDTKTKEMKEVVNESDYCL